MSLFFDRTLIEQYKSRSQIARVLTETWTEQNIFCPQCGNGTIKHFPNNRKAADFFCPNCGNQYELKSKSGRFGKKIPDGEYTSLITRINANDNPDFFFMRYDKDEFFVQDFFVVPKYFFVPSIIEKRKPLSENARRAGWTGCNILLDNIPEQGKVYLIKEGDQREKTSVLGQMKKISCLKTDNLDSRGWMMDVLSCINTIQTDIFTLDDVYSFEDLLSEIHPFNHNIRPKIRQQLQILREKGFLDFLDRGVYRKKSY